MIIIIGVIAVGFIGLFVPQKTSKRISPPRSYNQHAKVLPERVKYHTITPQPISKERFTRLNQRMRLEKARQRVVVSLAVPPTNLINILRQQAILLYQEENGLSWQEAAFDVLELEHGEQQVPRQLLPSQGADPRVTSLLLHADCREDAIAYFCASSGASQEEAIDAVDYIQTLNEQGEIFFEESSQLPDPFALQFLLQAGYRLLALRYYRACTGVSMIEAKQEIERLSV